MKRVFFALCVAVVVISTIGFMVKNALYEVKSIPKETYASENYWEGFSLSIFSFIKFLNQ